MSNPTAVSMESLLQSLPGQIESALVLGREFAAKNKFRNIRKVLFYGMGGSAIGGDILKSIMSDRSRVLFSVSRQDRWSRRIDHETLVIFSSYSGNTAEILDVFNQAVRSRARLLGVSSGGLLCDLAAKHRVPFLKIPGGMPPRCALGFLAFALLPALEKLGEFRIPDKEIQEVLKTVRHVPHAKVRRLAKQLAGRLIHIYSSSGFMQPAAVRWRAEIAENAKMLASHHLLPEMFHNEIEGWMHPRWAIQKSAAVFLTDRDDAAELTVKIAAASHYIRKQGGTALNVASQGNSLLARLFSLILFGDWLSYELALLNKVDPVTIHAISAIKQAGERNAKSMRQRKKR